MGIEMPSPRQPCGLRRRWCSQVDCCGLLLSITRRFFYSDPPSVFIAPTHESGYPSWRGWLIIIYRDSLPQVNDSNRCRTTSTTKTDTLSLDHLQLAFTRSSVAPKSDKNCCSWSSVQPFAVHLTSQLLFSLFLLSTFPDKMISAVLDVWLSRPYTSM